MSGADKSSRPPPGTERSGPDAATQAALKTKRVARTILPPGYHAQGVFQRISRGEDL